jgi:hypothetical protein
MCMAHDRSRGITGTLHTRGSSGCRVLDDKAARYSGQCAVGDLIVSISYVKPKSIDHVEELGLKKE